MTGQVLQFKPRQADDLQTVQAKALATKMLDLKPLEQIQLAQMMLANSFREAAAGRPYSFATVRMARALLGWGLAGMGEPL